MSLTAALRCFLMLRFLLFLSAAGGEAVLKEQEIITADPGQNVTLTCRAPHKNILVIKWSRADLESEYVLMYRDDQFVPDYQHPSFRNRVDLQDRQMKDGDVSVILTNVTAADEGTYECRVFTRGTCGGNLMSTITLRVSPPGPGNSEDGGKKVGEEENRGKKAGVSRGRDGLAAAGLLILAVVVVAAVISKKQKKEPPHPPDEEAKKELV